MQILQQINVKNIHQVFCARIWTQNFLYISCLPLPQHLHGVSCVHNILTTADHSGDNCGISLWVTVEVNFKWRCAIYWIIKTALTNICKLECLKLEYLKLECCKFIIRSILPQKWQSFKVVNHWCEVFTPASFILNRWAIESPLKCGTFIRLKTHHKLGCCLYQWLTIPSTVRSTYRLENCLLSCMMQQKSLKNSYCDLPKASIQYFQIIVSII